MRFRFSLRTFFFLVALFAAFCYYWFVRPTAIAQRFIQAVAAKDYASADQYFRQPEDQFMASSADKFWAFEAQVELRLATLGQLLRGQRHVHLHFRYFHLDQNVESLVDMTATSRGLLAPTISHLGSAVIIDRGAETGFEFRRKR